MLNSQIIYYSFIILILFFLFFLGYWSLYFRIVIWIFLTWSWAYSLVLFLRNYIKLQLGRYVFITYKTLLLFHRSIVSHNFILFMLGKFEEVSFIHQISLCIMTPKLSFHFLTLTIILQDVQKRFAILDIGW